MSRPDSASGRGRGGKACFDRSYNYAEDATGLNGRAGAGVVHEVVRRPLADAAAEPLCRRRFARRCRG